MKNLLSVKGGKRIPKGEKLLDIPTKHIYIRVTDMKNNTIDSSKIKYISDEVYEQIKNYTISSHDLYLTIAGTIGSVGIIPKEFDNMNLTENAVKLCNLLINKELLLYFIQSQFIQNQFVDKTNKVAQPKLAIVRIESTLIPLPPKSEQERIISKLVLFLPYIKIYSEKNKLIEELNSSYKEELKKSILQYAIQGKLVPQDQNNEPADILIQNILNEKRKLIKENQIKKENLSVIYKDDTDNQFYEKFDDGTLINITDEIPFDIPNTWAWARLGVISNYANNKSVQGNFIGDDEWILELEDIEKNTGIVLNEILQKDRKAVSNKHIFYKGNILYGKLRPYLKKVVIAHKDGYCTTEIIPIDFGELCNEYMKYLLLSNYFTDITTSLSYGAKMPRLGTKDAIKILLPIPPINEQKNIVNKIESIFSVLNS